MKKKIILLIALIMAIGPMAGCKKDKEKDEPKDYIDITKEDKSNEEVNKEDTSDETGETEEEEDTREEREGGYSILSKEEVDSIYEKAKQVDLGGEEKRRIEIQNQTINNSIPSPFGDPKPSKKENNENKDEKTTISSSNSDEIENNETVTENETKENKEENETENVEENKTVTEDGFELSESKDLGEEINQDSVFTNIDQEHQSKYNKMPHYYENITEPKDWAKVDGKITVEMPNTKYWAMESLDGLNIVRAGDEDMINMDKITKNNPRISVKDYTNYRIVTIPDVDKWRINPLPGSEGDYVFITIGAMKVKVFPPSQGYVIFGPYGYMKAKDTTEDVKYTYLLPREFGANSLTVRYKGKMGRDITTFQTNNEFLIEGRDLSAVSLYLSKDGGDGIEIPLKDLTEYRQIKLVAYPDGYRRLYGRKPDPKEDWKLDPAGFTEIPANLGKGEEFNEWE